jgi:uncharacterized protein YoxC
MHIPKLDQETILLAFACITGLALLLQTILLLFMAVAVRKTAISVRKEVENLRTSIMPVVYDARDTLASTQIVIASAQEFVSNTQGILARIAPKIESATGDLAEIAQGLRVQTAEIQLAAIDVMERVRRQSNRLDEMCTAMLDTMDRAGGFIATAVSTPVRQISGMLGTVKSVINSLRR